MAAAHRLSLALTILPRLSVAFVHGSLHLVPVTRLISVMELLSSPLVTLTIKKPGTGALSQLSLMIIITVSINSCH